MDQSGAIQETLAAGEVCLAAVQGTLVVETGTVESRLLGLVECRGKALVCLYTHRRMAVAAEDVGLERVLLIQEGFEVEEVIPENKPPILGSDVTIQMVSPDASLVVRLPFGSQTQAFLREVRKRCCPGAARKEDHKPKEEISPALSHIQGVNGGVPSPDEPRRDGSRKLIQSSCALVSSKIQGPSLQTVGLRETILRSQLLQKEDSYTHLHSFKFFVGTYSVNGQSPSKSLLPWLSQDAEPPDVYCVGFQALDLSKEALFFNDTPKEEEWFKAVTESLHPGAKYAKIKLVRLVGILLLLYVKAELAVNVSELEVATIGTGFMGRMGNKGAVAIRLRLHSTTVCLVNACLGAHPQEFEQRNQDLHDICAQMRFCQEKPILLGQHDVILWLGDLNYRLEEPDMDRVKRLAEAKDFQVLYQQDQLKNQMEAQRVFEGFSEGRITFPPTYKYEAGSDEWDTSEKGGAIAWCDRILFKGENICQTSYRSHASLGNSDHRPVSAAFDIGVKVVDEQLYRKAFQEMVSSLDRMENASIPSVTLSKRELHFRDVKFMQPQRESVSIHNGPIACRFEFISKPGGSSYCKPWLIARPSEGFLPADAEVTVELEVFVSKSTAANLNSGKDMLEDILVLRLDWGKDYFLSVSGNYLPSCFGSPLQALIYMREPIRDLLPETVRNLILRPLESGEDSFWDEKPLQIPKELWIMVDHLCRNACQQEDLFQKPGPRAEFSEIRDCLDAGMFDTLTGSSHSVAEALLLFLESLPEPVICHQLYDSCVEYAGSYVLSTQVVSRLPKCHKNVFDYLVAFLRELLQHSGKNHLDVTVLARIFGPVLLRPPPGRPAPDPATDQVAQEFIQQFLWKDRRRTR